MFYQNIKNAINHYVQTIKGQTNITGYRLNTLLNDIVDTISNTSWISQVITNGVTDKSPSEDAVFDALALKVDISSLPLEPLRYKALLSQNAPIASTSNVSMVAGQIWTLEIYSGLDGIDPFNGLELISGTIRVAGSKYRSNVDLTISFSTTEMSYDGSPYIVSTDANGDFNPFINTTGEVPTYSYLVAGRFSLNSPNNLYLLGKVVAKIGQTSDDTRKNVIDAAYPAPNSCDINTFISGTRTDGLLYYSLIEIEIYP